MNSSTATLIKILRERVEKLRSEGDLKEALHAANAAVDKVQQHLSPDLDTIDAFVTALEIRGDIHRELGNPEAARDDYQQALDQLDERPDLFTQAGRLHAAIGAAYDSMDDTHRAARHWLKAIECFEKPNPPLELDIAAMANNLGFLYKAAGEHDAAETNFLRSLEILHNHLGARHEETATVSSNLGALYHSAGFYEQAREMHMMALDCRRELFGEEHHDTAQSHNNLALALLATGDRSWARRHFEKALAAFEALGPDYYPDLEAVSENYCSFLRDEGENQLADVITNRVKELVGDSTAAV